MKYPKIDTLFNRNDKFKVMPDSFRRPEFDAVGQWFVTEKIDGMNIRYEIYLDQELSFNVLGRTDKAQIPVGLHEAIKNHFILNEDVFVKEMLRRGVTKLTIFGEGVGPNIQGNLYNVDYMLVVFDILVDDKWWLNHADFIDACYLYNLNPVPEFVLMTTNQVVDLVQEGFHSFFALRASNIFGVPAEGVILKTPFYDNRGNRIIAKLKTKDFE